MNKIRKLSKNGKIAIAGFCIVVLVMAIGIYGITNYNPSTTESVATDTVPQTNGTSSAKATPGYTTKIDSISKNANTVLNDSYTTLQKYADGAIDQDTAISRLQNNKASLNNALTEIQSLTPPQNLQHFHSLLISAFQDLNKALTLEISGVQNSNMNDIQSAADLTDSAISKLKQAKQETNQTA
ncbi:hypothetical protein [Methanobacterium sp.]|uniref:hypothetical protein n=1 Tax=Methanobacterium sp. TaxID=2164 RepID=UPI003C71C40F